MKTPAGNISYFFKVAEPFANLTSYNKPNETFSSAASLAAHEVKQIGSTTTCTTSAANKQKQDIKPTTSVGSVTSKPSTSTLLSSSSPHSSTGSLPSGNMRSKFIYKFDVASYRQRVKGMDSSQISELVRSVFQPDINFSFPKTNGRSHRYNWLELYSWLCYSPSMDGAFCLPCVLFGDIFSGKASKVNRLFSEPLCHWNDVAFTFKKHAGLGTGGEIVLHASTFAMLTALLA